MPKTAGIIAEYNPFHKGHKYQIDYLKSCGFEHIAVAMSGSCVQRGEFSLLSKFERAKYAVDCGVSLVCEIPYPYSSMSAEGFARSGVRILKNLGVSALCFGSESDDISLLCSIADYLLTDEYENALKNYLSQKLSFATAREKAITDHFDINRAVLSASNDILALEYIKECKKTGWDVEFVPVKRQGTNYNDMAVRDGFASAGYIRKCVSEYRFEQAGSLVPENIAPHLLNRLEQGDYFVCDTAFEKFVLAKLKSLKAAGFAAISDCNEELSHAFENAAVKAISLDSLLDNLPTKQYTRSRLNRIMLSAVMGDCRNVPLSPPFARILAMDAKGEEIVKAATTASEIPISHSYRILQDKNADCAAVVQTESFATDLQGLFFKFSCEGRRDYTTKLYKK